MTARAFVLAAALLGCAASTRAQAIVGAPERVVNKGHVRYAAESAAVAAGKPSIVELRFQVDPGFHVNSHKPSSDLLIPTALTIGDATVKVLSTEYPKGTLFHLAVGEGETLDVYQGEFRVRLMVVAPRGESTLTASLRYQACDAAACFPPRNLPVSVAITAK